MSWRFLQEREEAFWEGSSLDGAPSALLRLIPTADESCSSDSETGSLNRSRSGMTSELSTEDHGEEELMSSQVDSRAKTSAQQGRVPESQVSGLDCGPRWPESFARYDPATHSWRTHQCLLLGGLALFSETWPRWGLMRDEECLERTAPGLLIREIASGYLPTPTAAANMLCSSMQKWPRHRNLLYPTPTTHDASGRGSRPQGKTGNHHMASLEWVVMNLNMWPTPRAFMHKDSKTDRGKANLGEKVGGHLNPPWVEWLMGWPIEWTDLKPLGMDKFRQWLRLHGKS